MGGNVYEKREGGRQSPDSVHESSGGGGRDSVRRVPPPPKRSPDHYFLVDVELLTMMWYCWTVLLSLPVIGKVEMVTK